MRPKVIASDTETITFHVDSDSKKFLREAAKKQGRPFSELIREAIERYIEGLREDYEIADLRNKEGYKEMISVYDTATKSIEDINALVSKPEGLKELNYMWRFLKDNFIKAYLDRFRIEPPLEEIHPELTKIGFALLLGFAKQFLMTT